MELLARLEPLFEGCAPSLAWAADPGLLRQTALPAPEEQLVAGAVAKRQREFRSGRNLAHGLLRQVAQADAMLLRCPRGAPLWPQRVVGSLSHCDHLAICAVALQSELDMLGVDVEGGGPLDANLLPMILNDADRAFLRDNRVHDGRWGKCVFSAKEAAYKALYPQCQKVLDFGDISIAPLGDCADPVGHFEVQPTDRHPEIAPLCGRLRGRWLCMPEFVVTLVWARR